jgi:hypothetical protein
MRAKRVASLAAASLLPAMSLVVSTAQPAAAMCPPDLWYSLHATNNKMRFNGIPIFKDGPGGTLSVTKNFTSSVGFQVTAGAESEAGLIFAKAKVSISASLTKTNSSSITHNYSHNISRHRYGHAEYVSWGKTVYWKEWQQMGNCTARIIRSGTIKFPSIEEGWYYWETLH